MMATYFHGGSEIQAARGGGGGGGGGDNNLQTLYLMNPNLIAAYSESQTPSNMLFLNPANALPQPNLHAPPPPPPQQQQFIGIPLSGPHPHPSEDHSRPSPSSSGSLQYHHNHNQIVLAAALHGLSVSRVHPNLWSPVGNPSPSQTGPISSSGSGHQDMADQMGLRRPVTAQGLSLSLSPGQQQQQQHQNQSQVAVAGGSDGVILGSKYLKPAQELLEEVVSVRGNKKGGTGNGNDFTSTNNNNGENPIGELSGVHKEKSKAVVTLATPREQSSVGDGEGTSHGGSGGGGGESSSAGNKKALSSAELSTAQRQELQMKKAKLLNMLDEVEQRYRQYNTQMQVVVSSFEQAAGIGSAKLYTSLALKTISKQFRCLKDAIMSQIKATSKSLGEEDSNSNTTGVKLEGSTGSRLKFVDHQLRQQRMLQQLGMMQHNAWRPQRGLPERAVSVLRAWLFEHFLHPYPKDSDKHMLAKQTGLTRSQVSNWFINARVRLWKPMVEEMYLEELKTQEQNSTNSGENTTTNNNNKNTTSKHDTSTTKEPVPHDHHHHQDQGNTGIIQQGGNHTTNDMISNLSAMSTTSTQGFTLIGSSSDMDSLIARSPKKQRSNSDMQNSPSSILSMDMEMKPIDHHQRHSFLMSNHGDASATGFNPYLINDIAGRFNPDQMTAHPYHGNAVSLTLGLPHCENLSLGNHQQNFLPNQGIQLGRRLDVGGTETDFCGISMAQPSHPNNGYESIDIQNPKRYTRMKMIVIAEKKDLTKGIWYRKFIYLGYIFTNIILGMFVAKLIIIAYRGI